jgi:uncharacterized protein (TIGR02996 family)
MKYRSADFEAAIKEEPFNFHHRLVYADWLEDRGEAAYARAQRFLAENGVGVGWYLDPESKRERYLFGSSGIIDTGLAGRWGQNPREDQQSWSKCLLPHALFLRLGQDTWAKFDSPQEAVECLAVALSLTPLCHENSRAEVV